MSDHASIQVYLTSAQKKKFLDHRTFQLSSSQLSQSHGKHHVEITLHKHHHKKLLENVRKHKGFRFTPETIAGGSILSVLKPHLKSVLKSVAKSVAPTVLDYVGDKSGQKKLTDALKPSISGVVDAIAGGKLKKGSPEMKQKMANLRAMRKMKGGNIDGEGIFDDWGNKIKDGWNKTFTPDLGRKIVKTLKSPVAKTVYKGIADLGVNAIGDMTGNPVAGIVASHLANQAIDGLGVRGKGSPEMVLKMANLRSLRKNKKGRLNI